MTSEKPTSREASLKALEESMGRLEKAKTQLHRVLNLTPAQAHEIVRSRQRKPGSPAQISNDIDALMRELLEQARATAENLCKLQDLLTRQAARRP